MPLWESLTYLLLALFIGLITGLCIGFDQACRVAQVVEQEIRHGTVKAPYKSMGKDGMIWGAGYVQHRICPE
jgi:hypothetical protein